MKVDLVGQIIELDPTKKYLFIFDRMKVKPETIVNFMDAVVNKAGTIAMALDGDLRNTFMIVENSDQIADVVGKGNFEEARKEQEDEN